MRHWQIRKKRIIAHPRMTEIMSVMGEPAHEQRLPHPPLDQSDHQAKNGLTEN